MANAIEDILRKKEAERAAATPAVPQEDKFFSILLGEGLQEHFFELKFRDGSKTCFAYMDLGWFNYNPEVGLDLDFGGFLVTIAGRGFDPKLFQGIKQKRVAWVKEADVELEDHPGNDCFISQITITPPKGFTGEEEAQE